MRKKVVAPKAPKAPYLFHHFAQVPLIECSFHLMVTSDLEKMCNSKQFREIFPNEGVFRDSGFYGVTFYEYALGRVAIVLAPKGLCHNVIHHEIHHATLRIGSYIGCRHDHTTSEEFYAQVAGFIGDFVYRQLRDWKIPLV